jgi:hypothetical protein
MMQLPESPSPFFEMIEIPEDSASFDHDVLLPSGRVFGIVSDAESGLPIAGAEIGVEFRSGCGSTSQRSTFSLSSDQAGRFEATNLRDTAVDLEVSADRYSTARLTGILASASGTEVNVRLHRGHKARGRAIDDVGNPVADAEVGVDSDGDDFMQITRTNANGEFEFQNLSTAPHIFIAGKCGYDLALVRASIESSSDSAVTLPLTSRVHALTVHLERKGTAVGGMGVWFETDGMLIPRSSMLHFARRCGLATSSDSSGDLRVDFLPYGMLRAFTYEGNPLGDFRHDGSATTWRISLP